MENKQQQSIIFQNQYEIVVSKLDKEQRNVIEEIFKKQNYRGILKIIKQVLQNTSESQIKNIVKKYFGVVVVKEYIFGNLQAKPFVLNIFKVLYIQPNILIQLTDKITTFEHAKHLIQIIQILSISNLLQNDEKYKLKNDKLMNNIYRCFLKQFEDGKNLISNNQFKTKWLEHFVQILRCVNFISRFIGNNRKFVQDHDQVAVKYAKQCIQYSFMVTKQVISQLYLLLVYLDPNMGMPEQPLQQIHYLNALTIIKGENTLKRLLKIAGELKDTEYKNQLTPILLKSFQQFCQNAPQQGKQVFDEELKQNAFDCVIELFDVGRSIYPYLQQIVDIIISRGGNWSLQGSFNRKYFIAKLALKYVQTKVIFTMWPSCLQDCFAQSGSMTLPDVINCVQVLLNKLYIELNQNYKEWMNVWIGSYKKLLISGNRVYIRGITQFINPILIKINSQNSLLLKQISSMCLNNISTQLGIISLIKCYKQIGKIQSKYNVDDEFKKNQIKFNKKNKKYVNKQLINKQDSKSHHAIENLGQSKQKLVYIHLDDPSFEFGQQFLLDLLLSIDQTISLQTLDFLVTSKKPSTLIHPSQLNLIIKFYKNCLKTSHPQSRKTYLNLTRRLLKRCRINYEKDIRKKQKIVTQYYNNFIHFINQLIQECFLHIYPDSIFQITYPRLQILLIIGKFYGNNTIEIKKGFQIKGSLFLKDNTKYFYMSNFVNLITCMKSSYQSIRILAFQILGFFQDFSINQVEFVNTLWEKSLFNTNKLSIKQYQFACRTLIYISNIKINKKSILKTIPTPHQFDKLNLCYYLLEILKNRYRIFKKQFINQNLIYYQNLIHGILTCFSYLFDQISVVNCFKSNDLDHFIIFLKEFFQEIGKILIFAVQVSSQNNSTVILDTIGNIPQSDKKMKVDCRGHFLLQSKTQKTIGNFLNTPALISSMQNEEQGIQNALVVSFYLLTRQAGLVFQSIGALMGNQFIAKYVPKKQLKQLITSYFEALINLKHMGSVDRISNGLQKMSKIIFNQEDKDLIKIPQQLLNILIKFLNDGKFTNILRRSAGVPYAFACLLKSQSIKKKQLIDKTIKWLLDTSKQSTQIPIELRIHSLNILKKLFQQSDLKQDLDIYISSAFISSILGFTSQQWGVRNSSLMLFSVLANRTVGVKPTFNLLEFFHKCPDFLEFVTHELEQKKALTMYPPLYPIVLLLSRLLPFDLKEKARLSVRGTTNKQLKKQELLSLLPLVRQAGVNHNYMGRVMTAKAILPFMHLSTIIPYCLQLLQQYIQNIKNHKINNNQQHYRLTECYQLIISYHQIINSHENHYNIKLTNQTKQQINKILILGSKFINWKQIHISNYISPTVQQIYLKIYQQFISYYYQIKQEKIMVGNLIQMVMENTSKLFENLIIWDGIGDLGHSLMYKSSIQLLFICYNKQIQSNQQKSNIGISFINYLNSKNLHKNNKQDDNDYQMYSLVLQKVIQLLISLKNKGEIETQLQKKMDVWMSSIELQNISDDSIAIQILHLLNNNSSKIPPPKLQNFLTILKTLKSKTSNKHIKVAIFELVHSISKTFKQSNQNQQLIYLKYNLFIQSCLNQFSNPEQFQDLRECCIMYLEEEKQLKFNLFVVYLRLLEDQQYQIRRRACLQISRLLKIKMYNEVVVIRELICRYVSEVSYVQSLKSTKNVSDNQELRNQEKEKEKENRMLSVQQQYQLFTKLFNQNSDFEIRRKNHEQQRIFSYDKSNKYRTDITTIYYLITSMSSSSLKKVLQKLATKSQQQDEQILKIIEKYRQDIISRDQYQFQIIIRTMLMNNKSKKMMELLKNVSILQPILNNVMAKIGKAIATND